MKFAAAVAIAACLALTSCGAKQPTSRYAAADARKDEIRGLWMQIRMWRAEMGLRGVEPTSRAIRQMLHVPMHQLLAELAAMCVPPTDPSHACSDTCNLAENICENAEAICRIAGELRDDDWARRKCASAKASCKDAKRQCCACESRHGRR
ncbi:MAG: hypothetical protein D6689_18565 [Deltaproteobacteria bacterium]|nr:MAG: hypothetical protein D6689_18565 [Deltaproteobacteria bacterium]